MDCLYTRLYTNMADLPVVDSSKIPSLYTSLEKSIVDRETKKPQ